MDDIRAILSSFDRKERGWVARNALGNLELPLDPAFLSRIDKKLDLPSSLASDSWWGIDYHIDWLAISLWMFSNGQWGTKFISGAQPNDAGHLNHTIGDFDLIISDQERVVLIEAKAFGNWTEKQLDRKFRRLASILKDRRIIYNSTKTQSIEIFLLLMSVDEPPMLKSYSLLPDWLLKNGSPRWLKLETHHPHGIYKPGRCNPTGAPDRKGTHWIVKKEQPTLPAVKSV